MNRILIVDDNNDILWVVEIILKRYGFEVISTLRGEEVLSKSVEFHPDLILLDVFLSGVDGIDVCNSLKANPETEHIPIIMISAHTNFKEIQKFCKADDFISKPFDANELVRKIKHYIKDPVKKGTNK